MPYQVKKVKGGYKVAKKSDGKTFSKKPLTKSKAKKLMAAIGISEAKAKQKNKKKGGNKKKSK